MRLDALPRLSSPQRPDRAGQVAWRAIAGDARLLGRPVNVPVVRNLSAAYELIARAGLTHARPDYGIPSVMVGNREVEVTEVAVLTLPFGTLLRFKKDIDIAQPRVLVVAPLSGHFATLLRNTVRTLLAGSRRLHHRLAQRARRAARRRAPSVSTTTSTTSSSSWRSWAPARTSWPSASPACRRLPPSR